MSYVSRVYCTPYSSVEAVSGAPTAVEVAAGYRPDQDIHAAGPGARKAAADDGVFESLVTRWDVIPAGEPSGLASVSQGGGEQWTSVKLSIWYQFANPMYQISAGKFADEVAGRMIEAFEARAKKILGSHDSVSD